MMPNAILVAVAAMVAASAPASAQQDSKDAPMRPIATEISPALLKLMGDKRAAEEKANAKAKAKASASASANAKTKSAADVNAPSLATAGSAESTVEPMVITANIDKCLECKTSVKRRLAVIPARVGSVAVDAGSSAEVLQAVLTDRLEAAFKSRPGVLVLGRNDLAAVLGEQQLAASGVTQAELAPQRGRVIPAELLLRVTVDRVDVKVDTRRVASSNAAAMLERAQQLENEAQRHQEAAADGERQALASAREAAQMKAQNDQLQAQMQAQAQSGSLTRGGMNLGLLGAALGSYSQANSEAESQRNVEEARKERVEAQRKLLAARQQKERAQTLARTDLVETRTTFATLSAVWRAIDSMTGEIVVGDTIKLSDKNIDSHKASSNGSTSTDEAQTSRAQGLVNKLLDSTVEGVADKLVASLEKVPFRGQIVRADRQGVVLNVGKNLDVEVGDTFSVKRIDTSLIDPATGQSLAGPGTLEGLIRVVDVSDKVSKAVVIRNAGKLARGDVLEWVGVYK